MGRAFRAVLSQNSTLLGFVNSFQCRCTACSIPLHLSIFCCKSRAEHRCSNNGGRKFANSHVHWDSVAGDILFSNWTQKRSSGDFTILENMHITLYKHINLFMLVCSTLFLFLFGLGIQEMYKGLEGFLKMEPVGRWSNLLAGIIFSHFVALQIMLLTDAWFCLNY